MSGKSKPKAKKIGGWKKTLIAAAGSNPRRANLPTTPPGTYHFDAEGRLQPGAPPLRSVQVPPAARSGPDPNDVLDRRVGQVAGAAGGSAVVGTMAAGTIKALKAASKPNRSNSSWGGDGTVTVGRDGAVIWNSSGQPLLSTPGSFRAGPGQYPRPKNVKENVTVITPPVTVGVRRSGNDPHMWANAKNGDVEVVVEHTEYIRDCIVPTSPTFTNSTSRFPVNPGNRALFAWLSDLAGLFDEYEFEKLEFVFEPMKGTDSDGKTLMTFDPDVSDDVPASKQEMLQARVQLDAPIWTRSVLPVPKDLLRGRRYVRGYVVPDGNDPHIYDLGQLVLSFVGADAGDVGELFVRYKIRLCTPNGEHSQAGYSSAVAPAVATPLGESFESFGQVYPTYRNGTTFNILAIGDFELIVESTGTVFTGAGTLSVSAPNTVTLRKSAFTATSAMARYTIHVEDPGENFSWTAPATAATLTATDLVMFETDPPL